MTLLNSRFRPRLFKYEITTPYFNIRHVRTLQLIAQDMKKWEARAEERLAGQRLQDEDMVWLRAPAELSGRRAVVVTAKGVPDLDRVRCVPLIFVLKETVQ